MCQFVADAAVDADRDGSLSCHCERDSDGAVVQDERVIASRGASHGGANGLDGFYQNEVQAAIAQLWPVIMTWRRQVDLDLMSVAPR